MADPRPGGEPTEKPTPKRLRDARKKGQVAKSRDFSGVFVFWAGLTVIIMTASNSAARMMLILRTCFTSAENPSSSLLRAHLDLSLTQMFLILAPIVGAVFVGSIAAGFLQTRGLFTLEPLKPKLSHLNIMKGLGRLVGKQSLFTMAKTLLFFCAAGFLAYFTIRQQLPSLMRTLGAHPRGITTVIFEVFQTLCIRMGLLFVVAGIADYAFNRHSHQKKMMMTKYEVRKEMKESEGDPQHKNRRREVHQEILESAMIQSVADADFVVCNPTKLALALRYHREKDNAPVVIAKGQNLLAKKIREAAQSAGVPIFHDVSLARALWELDLNREIPQELYEAVAVILKTISEESESNGRK